MITVTLPEKEEGYNEITNEFYYLPEKKIRMEYSLKAIRQWEATTHKPFFTVKPMDVADWMLFYQCMCLDDDITMDDIARFNRDNIEQVQRYIGDPYNARCTVKGEYDVKTETYVNIETKKQQIKDQPDMSVDQYYCNMILAQIPIIPCEEWNINQLQALLSAVCDAKQKEKDEIDKASGKHKGPKRSNTPSPGKKRMTGIDRAALNAQRCKDTGTTG